MSFDNGNELRMTNPLQQARLVRLKYHGLYRLGAVSSLRLMRRHKCPTGLGARPRRARPRALLDHLLKFVGWPLTRGINSGRGKALYKTCLVHLTHPCSAHTSEWFKTIIPTPPHHRGYAGGGGTFSHVVGRFLTTGTSCVMCTSQKHGRCTVVNVHIPKTMREPAPYCLVRTDDSTFRE